MKSNIYFSAWLIIQLINNISMEMCTRKPQGAFGDRSLVDATFQVLIEGNPYTFIPGQKYNVSLSSSSNTKFISFTISVETENVSQQNPGQLVIIDGTQAQFSSSCKNLVENTNTNAKSQITIGWVAPSDLHDGCVAFKAAVLQHRNVWFMDDGFLTKRICADESSEINSPFTLEQCCACDEAKYEVKVERKWSRNTHPKDYPLESWRARLSEVVGASHSSDYKIWEYGKPVRRGLQEFAEHGSMRQMELEMLENNNLKKIRTIVKSPSLRNNRFAYKIGTVRVDPIHHFLSIVTKIEPSPDWILGVTAMELCQSNCTWVDKKVVNLYPIDIGTDNGPSYMSPDQPQVPPSVVHHITSQYPPDHRSPFFDITGMPIKPFATLYITRKKVYERKCDLAQYYPIECATHPWSAWSECSSLCGMGTQYRERSYKDPLLAENLNCLKDLKQNQSCFGSLCGRTQEEFHQVNSPECNLQKWSPWSPCSVECGRGYTTRIRQFDKPSSRDKCQNMNSFEMEQRKECFGENCGGSIDENDAYNYNNLMTYSRNNSYGSVFNYNASMNGFRQNDRNAFWAPKPTHFNNEGHLENTSNKNLNNTITNSLQTMDDNAYFSPFNPNKEYCSIKPRAPTALCRKHPIKIQNYWFYDAVDKQCKIYTTDNCDESKNRFRTLEACMRVCAK